MVDMSRYLHYSSLPPSLFPNPFPSILVPNIFLKKKMAAIPDSSNPNPEELPEPTAMPDLEKAQPAAGSGATPADGGSAVVTSVVRRWRREDLLVKSSLLLRAVACLFSLVSFALMASNKHGDWKDFDHYEEYRYIVAISVLGFLYSMGQVARQVHLLNGGTDPVPGTASRFLDFVGDQVIAYLLISALSAAIPITNRMQEGADNIFTDASAASISMAFFAFLAFAFSALISGFKLSKQTYV